MINSQTNSVYLFNNFKRREPYKYIYILNNEKKTTTINLFFNNVFFDFVGTHLILIRTKILQS
jgi:hypothetical protein